MPIRWTGVSLAALAAGLPSCVDLSGLHDELLNPCGREPCAVVARTCAELSASDLHWSLRGFLETDIVDPDRRDQRELTAIVHVGEVKPLRVSASGATAEDCSGKAAGVEWESSDRATARLEVTEDRRSAALVALRPGDVVISAELTFADGTPPMRILPWAFTNVGSGDVTLVRVVP